MQGDDGVMMDWSFRKTLGRALVASLIATMVSVGLLASLVDDEPDDSDGTINEPTDGGRRNDDRDQ